MSNANQTEYSDLEDSIPSVLPYKEISPESCNSFFDLNAKPAETLSFQQHEGDELLIDFLEESLY